MNVSILTLGCKVNQAESAIIEGNLRSFGFTIVDLANRPQFCIVNTCTVTKKSDYQSRQLIRRSLKTGAKTIVTGCYAQVSPTEIMKIDGEIILFNNNIKYNLINALTGKNASSLLYYTNRSRPYIKVQDGCNMSCSYCIVPLARGRSRSIGIFEILDQISCLESQGYQEIVLTGIHLGAYGKDLKPKTDFAALLAHIIKKTKIDRIRLSSLEVNEINEKIVELLQEKRICRHVHIPLQSGDSSILKTMNRTYNSNKYKKKIEMISKKIPGVCIGCDVIVGFPGEGDLEFKKTRSFLESLPLSYLHIFPFSPRQNTTAATLNQQIEISQKRFRYNSLNDINIQKREIYLTSQIDRDLEIVVEDQIDENNILGTSSNYQKVKVKTKQFNKKSLMHVRVTGVDQKFLRAIPIEKR